MAAMFLLLSLRQLCVNINVVLIHYLECCNRKSHYYLAEERFIKVLMDKVNHYKRSIFLIILYPCGYKSIITLSICSGWL